MPRIPTRTEPYTSPSRQHRHFKTKRDIILKSLGKASYINGCQFAITLISARGDIETYGSEICSERLNEVFNTTVLDDIALRVRDVNERRREEAIRNGETSDARCEASVDSIERDKVGKLIRVNADMAQRKDENGPGPGAEAVGNRSYNKDNDSIDGDTACGDDDPENLEETQQSVRALPDSPFSGSLVRERTSVLMEVYMNPNQMGSIAGIDLDDLPQQSGDNHASPKRCHAEGIDLVTPMRSNLGHRPFPFDSPVTNNDTSGQVCLLPDTPRLSGSMDSDLPWGTGLVTPATQRSRSTASLTNQRIPLTPIQLNSENVSSPSQALCIPCNDLQDWYASKLDMLQQQTCKIVVKAWIKVIEPKKQTKYPYNKGEAGRPGWWPQGVRHREPDHLMKPERTELAIAILRSSIIKVSRLEISTAENLAYIPVGRMAILREIYRVAKEDERMRETGDQSGRITVQIARSPPPSTNSSGISVARTNTQSRIKAELPATLPRAALRETASGSISSPLSKVNRPINRSPSTGVDINGNFRILNREPAFKKRKLTREQSMSLPHFVQHGNAENNAPDVTQSNLFAPVPISRIGLPKRPRASRNPEPIAIGTVQLDDDRPNTVLGLRTAECLPRRNISNAASLAESPLPDSFVVNRPWSTNSWSAQSGGLAQSTMTSFEEANRQHYFPTLEPYAFMTGIQCTPIASMSHATTGNSGGNEAWSSMASASKQSHTGPSNLNGMTVLTPVTNTNNDQYIPQLDIIRKKLVPLASFEGNQADGTKAATLEYGHSESRQLVDLAAASRGQKNLFPSPPGQPSHGMTTENPVHLISRHDSHVVPNFYLETNHNGNHGPTA